MPTPRSSLAITDTTTLLQLARYVPLRRHYLDLQTAVPDGPWSIAAVHPGVLPVELTDYPPLESVIFPARTELNAKREWGRFLRAIKITRCEVKQKTFYPSPKSMMLMKADGTQLLNCHRLGYGFNLFFKPMLSCQMWVARYCACYP